MNTPTTQLAHTHSDMTKMSPALYNKHQEFWVNNQPSLDQITMTLPDACVDEFDRILKQSTMTELSLAELKLAMPATAAFTSGVSNQLENECGAALIDRIPTERYTVDQNRKICRYVSTLIAPLMAQNHAGTTLYDVMDKKVEPGQKVRRSITNLKQDYHTDGGWFIPPARYIGLFCVQSAETGGFSTVTSIMAAYKAMQQSADADAIKVLEQPQPWDRQGEHAKNDTAYAMAPVFVENEEGFLSRWYETYVRDGYQLKGESVPQAVDDALNKVADYLDQQSKIRFLLQPGQFQYVNNYTVVHGREAFVDPNPQGGRHLIRVWHK